MQKFASSVEKALIESFWSSMQAELLDRQVRDQPGRAHQRHLRMD
jgi:hypothetical protein